MKNKLVFLGAGLIAISLLIMHQLVTNSSMMNQYLAIETWYVIAALLAPFGYVVQDAVADAMSVEAVPRFDSEGEPLGEEQAKALHTTMQTLSRFALISGIVAVALLNLFMFADVETMTDDDKLVVYSRIYLLALAIPAISVTGVVLALAQGQFERRRIQRLGSGVDQLDIRAETGRKTETNHWYFTGGILFLVLSLAIGLSDIPLAQEIVFTGSMAIVLFLMRQLLLELDADKARALVGTAAIIFVFRAVPLPGPGASWFEIDVLGFDQQFISVLYLITSMLALAGMIVLRPLMSNWSISNIVILLTLAAGVLSLPNIGLFYGLHHWTEAQTGGVVDARFIAIMDAAVESPLGQVAMIPMLAWIARNAPDNLKATFFAVMASFTNLALSASSLGTKYLNQIFEISREVRDRATGEVTVAADYGELGLLLITVTALTVVLPLATIAIVQVTAFSTRE